jgi:hypothetical protein
MNADSGVVELVLEEVDLRREKTELWWIGVAWVRAGKDVRGGGAV